MAPEHQQREHEGNGGKEREDGGKDRGLQVEGVETKRWRKKQKDIKAGESM